MIFQTSDHDSNNAEIYAAKEVITDKIAKAISIRTTRQKEIKQPLINE